MSKRQKYILFNQRASCWSCKYIKTRCFIYWCRFSSSGRRNSSKDKYVNALLIGSTKHIEILSRKELAQPFGLKDVAKVLKILNK